MCTRHRVYMHLSTVSGSYWTWARGQTEKMTASYRWFVSYKHSHTTDKSYIQFYAPWIILKWTLRSPLENDEVNVPLRLRECQNEIVSSARLKDGVMVARGVRILQMRVKEIVRSDNGLLISTYLPLSNMFHMHFGHEYTSPLSLSAAIDDNACSGFR